MKSLPMGLRSLTAGSLSVLVLVAIAGCGDGKIALYPVTGTVVIDGKPAEGAMVILCPVDGSPELMRVRPVGNSDAAGKFQMTTFAKHDGAPAGSYKVTVSWPAPSPQTQRDGPPNRNRGPDRLRGRYSNLETTTLTASVAEEPTELPPIDLKTK